MPVTHLPNCMQTKVRNMSGKTRDFSMLPPHGRRLAPGDEYVFNGDIFTALRNNQRKLRSFIHNLTTGDLALVATPSPHFYDETRDETKVLNVLAGAVVVRDPCWGEYSSSLTL